MSAGQVHFNGEPAGSTHDASYTGVSVDATK